jgi:predicted RNA-binding Zn ribbon-like protein
LAWRRTTTRRFSIPQNSFSPAPDLPFQYIGGDPALDLVNTVDWTSRGPEQERLTDFDGLTRWAEGAGVLPLKTGVALRRAAATKPREAETAYQAALEARQVLQRLLTSIAEGKPAGDELNDFNRLLVRALEHMRVVPAPRGRGGSRQLRLGWENQETRLDAVLWPVLWSAASLIFSDEASLIRVCGGADCGWMYVDRSRNGLRRWCQMETCGTREKSRRRYERIRSAVR